MLFSSLIAAASQKASFQFFLRLVIYKQTTVVITKKHFPNIARSFNLNKPVDLNDLYLTIAKQINY